MTLEDVTWNIPVPRETNAYKRPLVKLKPGDSKLVPYTRATTYIDCLEDKTGLDKWHQRKVARGLVKQSYLYRAAAALGDMPADEEAAKAWKNDLNNICWDAQKADSIEEASSDGTALHSFTQRLDLGQDMSDLPPEFRQHIDNYRKVTERLDAAHVERFMVHDGLKIGGTPDRILRMDGYDRLIIGDVKTGSLEYPAKMAMQLAIYAHSQLYNPATGERTTLDLDTELGLIVGLNLKTAECTLHWIDLKLGWEGVELASQVRAWRRKRKFTTAYEMDATQVAFQPTLGLENDLVAQAQRELTLRIDNAESPEALVAIWRLAGTAWTPEHTARAAARKAEMTA